MPSYSELTTVVGFRSKNAAYKLVKRLIDQGWLEKDASRQTPAGTALLLGLPGARHGDSRISPRLPRKSWLTPCPSMSS